MTWRISLLLAILGLAMAIGVARFQAFPGYLDSDYYFGGGLQLVQGKGFFEPYLWNYLDDPQGLPHPSHSYWMPLASLIAAAGMWLAGQTSYAAGRAGFIALAAIVPVVAGSLAYAFSRRRDLALTSGLLAVFSAYYVPFMPVPDNYGVYLVFGGLFLLTLGRRGDAASFVMGLIAGIMTLARSDGLLWLALAGVSAVLSTTTAMPDVRHHSEVLGATIVPSANLSGSALRIALTIAGFAVVIAPWIYRNYGVHGSPLPPGGDRLLWLASYDETFVFPAERLTFSRWIDQGLPAILSARVAALRWNLLNAFAAQGGIFLFPFIIFGAWIHRRDVRVQIGLLGWLLLLVVMTVVFPFAGARGGFFHAGAGFQCLWWALAPLGLETAIAAVRRRGLFTPVASSVFRAGLIGISVLTTAVIIDIRVLPGWGEGEETYPEVEALLTRFGARPAEIVMVRNPPGYYVMTGRSAIVVPYAEADGILAAARRYDASYLIIENAGAAGPIKAVYADQNNTHFELLDEIDGTRIFRVRR